MENIIMPCRECCPAGGAVFEGNRLIGWQCRNCGHTIRNSKAEALEIMRQYSAPKDTALQAITNMDAEIKRLRAALSAKEQLK